MATEPYLSQMSAIMALRGYRGGFLAAKDVKIVLFFRPFSPIVLTSETITPL
jgi:hypothetical protein